MKLLPATFLVLAMPFGAAAETPKEGEIPPPYAGTTLEGREVQVTEYAGKAVIVSYWATWCPFCIKELDMLNRVQKVAPDRVQVIAVNTEPKEVFQKVAEALKPLSVQLLYDPDGKAQATYGIKAIPYMVIVGKDGRIDSLYKGYSEDELDDILVAINRAIAATPATPGN
jgi:thiol-disulfide isomerase/thioredoxin